MYIVMCRTFGSKKEWIPYSSKVETIEHAKAIKKAAESAMRNNTLTPSAIYKIEYVEEEK